MTEPVIVKMFAFKDGKLDGIQYGFLGESGDYLPGCPMKQPPKNMDCNEMSEMDIADFQALDDIA